MFSLFSGVYNEYWAPQQLNVLTVGAKGVGKTSLLERMKVTTFDRRSGPATAPREGQSLPADILRNSGTTGLSSPAPPVKTAIRRSWMSCPAPEKYHTAVDDDDDEGEADEQTSFFTASTNDMNYDQHPKRKMLPLDKLRPTIGMNLGKVDICGAKCCVWDLGGRLQNLWERYYEDCDAVVFVWQVLDENSPVAPDDDDDDDSPPVTYEHQEQLLNQVREAIPDEVPFLVIVHFRHDTSSLTDQCFSTAPYLLGHYHNPLQALFLANARTGQGVRAAMQWLIPLAKKQQRIRKLTKI